MYFLAHWFPPALTAAAWPLLAVLLALTAKPALACARRRPEACAVATVLLSALWGLNAALGGGQLAGMSYHLLGIGLAALMLGAPAALWLGVLLTLAAVWLRGAENMPAAALNALFVLLPPLGISLLFRLVAVRLPPNLFIYIFFNGFTAAAVGMLCTGAAVAVLLQAAGAFAAEVLWGSAFPVFFLLAWGEAFLSGFFTAVFVALKPHWLATFDDARYLRPQNRIWK